MTDLNKPVALKLDKDGNCVAICRTGQLEYIHKLITEDNFPQQDACQTFIDACNAHVNEGDPITSELTVEKVRSQYRRDTGKLKDKPKKTLVGPTKELDDDEILRMAEEIKVRRFLEWLAGVSTTKIRWAIALLRRGLGPEGIDCGICNEKQHCGIRRALLKILENTEDADAALDLIKQERPDCWFEGVV